MISTSKTPRISNVRANSTSRTLLSLSCAAVFALTLGGCRAQGNEDAASDPAEVKPPPDPVDEAVFAIPPADRKIFRRALECEIARNEGPALDLNPKYLTELGQRLAEDPTLANC